MGILSGKKALILGIANERSIAYGIAKELKNHGASLGITYLNDAMGKRVLPIAEELGADFTLEMDVAIDDHFQKLKDKVLESWGKFDFLVHSLAFAPTEDLKGKFMETSKNGYLTACHISAYSFLALGHCLSDCMNPDSSMIAMTYHGAQQVVKNYNVMGVAKAALECTMRYMALELGEKSIRVNCISSGPIRTLAASGGVSGFREILKDVENRAPLHRNVTPEDVGGMAVYLASDLSKNVTGQVLYVDSGHTIVAL